MSVSLPETPLPLVVRVLAAALGRSQTRVRALRKTATVGDDGVMFLLPECRLAPNDSLHPFAKRLLRTVLNAS